MSLRGPPQAEQVYDPFLSLELFETNDGFRGTPGDSLRNPTYYRFDGPPYGACVLHPGTYAICRRWPGIDSEVHSSTHGVLVSNGGPSMQHTLVVR